jgi:ABC-type long-subunit fatty acid transport system fused permease/ATPase subunit
MKNKFSIALIGMGILNLLHGLMHIFQFLQSMLLLSASVHESHDHSSWIDEVMHNPWMALVWAIIGVLTLYIGIKDYKHHRKCKD